MNLAAVIDRHPADAVALVSRGQPTTYGELREQVGALRGGLASLGVGAGDRVAIVSPNNWFFVVAHLAALGAGAVVVPLNPASPAAELQRELAVASARLAIVGPSARDAFAAVDRTTLPLEHVVVPEGVELPDTTSLSTLFDHEPAAIVERADGDDAVLIFTAGTAGTPKAARLTHGSLRANLEQVQAHPGLAARADDVILGVLPLFHIFGLNVVLGLALHAGASVVLVERFDPVSTLDLVREARVTIVPAAPPVFAAWASIGEARRDALHSVRLAVSGGAALPPHVAADVEARFGLPVWEGYGLTECSPIVSSSLVGGQPRPGSIGVPLPGVEVRLVDADGETALVGDEGEIWVRGPNVFAGYWHDDEATTAVLTADGWLRTGDVAVADDDGYLYLVDRAKDVVIVSGFNVHPAEVEEVLLTHPGIEQAAVVGVPHPQTGETVKAFVVPVAGRHLEEDEVIEFCAEHLARYKCPTTVSFVPELPQGLVGKVLRRALR